MLKKGIIRPSHLPWASPITLASISFYVDYRRLNTVTKKDADPLPHSQEVFDQIRGAKIFSRLDLISGYWQIPMGELKHKKQLSRVI